MAQTTVESKPRPCGQNHEGRKPGVEGGLPGKRTQGLKTKAKEKQEFLKDPHRKIILQTAECMYFLI